MLNGQHPNKNGAHDDKDLRHIAEPLRTMAVPIESLNPDASNTRKHSDRNLTAIAASFSRWGQRTPIVVQREGMVIRAGNGRFQAAKKLGWKYIAAMIVDESNIDAASFAIADNRTAELAEWDDEALVSILQSLSSETLPDTGFTQEELDKLISSIAPEIADDEAPEPPANPISKRGDIWQCGNHRVMCGDSTSGEDVKALLDGATPFIMVTDPPYGVEYDPAWRNEAAAKGLIGYAARREGVVENDDKKEWTEAYRLFFGDVAYVWHAGRFAADLVVNLRDAGLEIRTQIIWKKPAFAISRGHYHWQHEPCWYTVRKGASSKWCGDRSQSTVWDISNRVDHGDNSNHGTQKPVECMARPIRNHGGNGDHVYDPFLGSGTTMIAAEQLGRTCFGMEISPAYVDVCVQRWEKLTGKKAELVSTPAIA